MLARIKAYFAQYTRTDWETLGYLCLILVLVFLLPVIGLWDYVTSYYGQWEWLKWEFFLTKTLQYWWAWILDKLGRLW